MGKGDGEGREGRYFLGVGWDGGEEGEGWRRGNGTHCAITDGLDLMIPSERTCQDVFTNGVDFVGKRERNGRYLRIYDCGRNSSGLSRELEEGKAGSIPASDEG